MTSDSKQFDGIGTIETADGSQTDQSRPRQSVSIELFAIPIGPDGLPDVTAAIPGRCVSLNLQEIGLELDTTSELTSRHFVLRTQCENGEPRFAGVQLNTLTRISDRQIELDCRFGGPIDRILCTGHMSPRFHINTMAFVFDFPEFLLMRLAELGILKQVVIDRVQLCPNCHGLPTFREGCRKCGSSQIATDRFIHHFACAYVRPVDEFQTTDGLMCPKCLARNPVVGADFEYLTGEYQCLDCFWRDSDLEQIGHCLRCRHRFPTHQSSVQDVTGFYAARLDPLDVIVTA